MYVIKQLDRSVDSSSNGKTSTIIFASGNMPRYYLQLQHLGFSCKFTLRWIDWKRNLTATSDIAYYGINLNQSVVLTRIGYAKGATPWETLYKTAIGNIIVQAAVSSSITVYDTLDPHIDHLTGISPRILRRNFPPRSHRSRSPAAVHVWRGVYSVRHLGWYQLPQRPHIHRRPNDHLRDFAICIDIRTQHNHIPHPG